MPRKNHGVPNEKAARGRSARRRGHDFERQLAADMRSAGFPGAMRHLEYQIRQCKGYDLDCTGRYRIQAKRSAKVFASPKVLEEIQPEAGTIPIVVTSVAYKPPVAYIHWSDLLRLIRLAQTGTEEQIVPAVEEGVDQQ